MIKDIKEQLFHLYELLEIDEEKDALLKRKTTTIENDKLISLDLSELKIKEIPSELFENEELFKNLKLLNLGYNDLIKLPNNIFEYLPSLEKLELYTNNLIVLPEINLPKLIYLDLSNNDLNITGNDFKITESLEHLDIGGNKLESIESDTFKYLTKLINLNISENGIKELNKDIFVNLQTLKELNISENKIKDLDSSIFSQLTNLTELDLRDNRIQKLEKDIFLNNSKLEKLDLDSNKLKDIQEDTFMHLTSLTSIGLSWNNLNNIPLKSSLNLEELYLIGNDDLPEDLAINFRGKEPIKDVLDNYVHKV